MAATEPINIDLARHQEETQDWMHQSLAKDLHTWSERFILEFKLQTGVPALCLEQLRGRALGHYRHGRNGFGLRDEIAIDLPFAQAGPHWRVLGTVLHELIHSWQEHHGKSGRRNYHNGQFRAKALDFGLVVNSRGETQFLDPPSAFWRVLQKYGVEAPLLPQLEIAEKAASKGSKLRLWTCHCGKKIRYAKSDLNSVCLDCHSQYVLQNGNGRNFGWDY